MLAEKYTLKDTVPGMTSDDYKDRFVAEYEQLRIRRDALHRMIIRYDAGTLNFTPTCDIFLLKRQEVCMNEYLVVLETRAELEGIILNY